MTKEQARVLYERWSLDRVFNDPMHLELLEERNPKLMEAYVALRKLAFN